LRVDNRVRVTFTHRVWAITVAVAAANQPNSEAYGDGSIG
jgi:hypothetical protein